VKAQSDFTRTITVPIYGLRVSVTIADDTKSAAEMLGYDTDDLPNCDGCSFNNYDGTFHIVMSRKKLSIDLIAHEGLHVSKWIIEHCGVSETEPNEAHAYLHGWLVNAVTKIAFPKKYETQRNGN